MNFLKRYYILIILVVILISVLGISLTTLRTKPKLWGDEALSIELARNFSYQHTLNAQIAPGIFYPFPHFVQATGYPVTVPLALVFKFFGHGLFQARLYMIAWMTGLILSLFFMGRNIFDEKQALVAVALFVTFASFYGSGRTVIGEIPGFTMFLIGLYFWMKRQNYFIMGVFWGLAVVSKPSLFGLLIPTICVTFLLESDYFFDKIKRIGAVALGMVPAGILWIFFVIDHPFSRAPWVDILHFFQNPYSSPSITNNIAHNLSAFFGSTTLLYFGFLFAIIVMARFLQREKIFISLYNFVILYGVFAFMYYLRSPGWIRYILIAELLILFTLPNAIRSNVAWLKKYGSTGRLKEDVLSYGVMGLLISIQAFQLFTGAQIYESSSAIMVADFVNTHFPNASVASLDAIEVSVLLKTEKRFSTAHFTGMPPIGENPLLRDEFPDIVLIDSHHELIAKEVKEIKNRYRLVTTVREYNIYSSKEISK